MNNELNTMLVGLPGSGKTTFIAALWDVLTQKQHSLKLGYRQEDRKYLEDIYERWASFKEIERSKTEIFEPIELTVTTLDNEVLNMNFPDISGELYKDIYNNRAITQQLVENIQDCNSLLLFIHPDKWPIVTYIQDVNSELPKSEEREQKEDKKEEEKEFTNFELSHPQAVVTDIVYSLTKYSNIINIAVIISAWDKVINLGLSPAKYIEEVSPLFNMFLKNSGINYKIFGISAQGGNYEIKEELEKLYDCQNSVDRIKVVEGENESNDITLPLTWIINQK